MFNDLEALRQRTRFYCISPPPHPRYFLSCSLAFLLQKSINTKKGGRNITNLKDNLQEEVIFTLHRASKHIQKLEEVQILRGMLQQVKKIVWRNGGRGGGGGENNKSVNGLFYTLLSLSVLE